MDFRSVTWYKLYRGYDGLTEWVSKMESDCPLSVGQKAKEEKPKSLEWQGTNRNRLKN